MDMYQIDQMVAGLTWELSSPNLHTTMQSSHEGIKEYRSPHV